MRKLNEKLIKQLTNGEIAVENTWDVEDLQQVIKAAFPKDETSVNGLNKYYYASMTWDAVNETTLPSIPLTDFFINEPEPTELKWNQPVEVRDSEDEEWGHGYVFGCMNPSPESQFPFLVFRTNYSILFKKFCRPIQTIKLTRAEYAEKLGISVGQIDRVQIVD